MNEPDAPSITPTLPRLAAPGPRRGSWDGFRALAIAVVAGGVLVGALWAVLAPSVIGHSDQTETQASADGTLAILELAAGIVTATVLALRPGNRPAARFAIAIVASTGGAFLGWAVGAAVGAPRLVATGVVLLWPFAAAAITVLRTVGGLVFHGE